MKYSIGLLSIILLFSACTKDFEAINTNENAPSEVQPELLLRQVLYGYGDAMSYEGFVAGNLLSQHFAMIDFNLFDRHALSSPQEGGNPWDVLYVNLRDNETILQLSRENLARAVYEGPALVMKSYLAMTLTDMFGDVPYFEAFQGRTGTVTPKYDGQRDIYLNEGGILDNLEKAVVAMENYQGAQQLRGDIVFEGDLSRWIRFANSLRIKALLRISDREDVASQINALYSAGNYLQSNADNATFDFAAGPPNSFAFATARVGIFNVFLMSKTAEEILLPLNDPRTGVIYRPSTANGEFRGIVNGINAASSIVPDNFARPGRVWRENTGALDFNFLTAWETNFLLAEAALKGYIDADAGALYDLAVSQAFAYWQTELPADYLTTGPAAWNPANGLELIITQKWIASIGNAYEGWAEWRRTGIPANLRPAEASLNNGLFPVRMPYPSNEQALNFENYRAAATATEDNSINVPVWWDVE
ncbi:SusD/RagB family nutrient-binding outer membrane lipoprotein [Neolewinella lacunae]|uniref:SusD/RagB family nutrient-binding outer membrane lipoprotein n=1 Tax=Neolewinella lacunae TaxID=1517758 RepID=A0A923PKK6_9BACT|nr:SusD/RagB family nutrient-binding outer membrane lipoprotein [Neolewinella lacunae]MBC6993406.1 SusD/RagB family nutrient-binding outer membrane lipoprotein [Neolewinella lacunae]MDN3636318.1 SusD/RagB family nutrient-binding outer membrane lipoprotein [Neolewinella lacunae]